MFMLEFKFLYRIFFLSFIFLLIFNQVNAETKPKSWIGIEFRAVTEEFIKNNKLNTDTPKNIIVIGVVKTSAADEAKILPGDVIISIDNNVIKKTQDLINFLKTTQAGDIITAKIYRNGSTQTKKIITINEKNKKIRNLPVVWGPQWNYRNSGEYTYIYEVADFRKQMIIRFTIDLENLLEETIYLKVTEKNIEDIKMLKLKFDRGEITYDAIDQLKMKSFDQSFKNPKTTKNKVVKNWRNDWEGGHPEEYIMYENNSDLSYQFSMIHRCNFVN